MATETETLSLVRYYVWADIMRELFEQAMARDDAMEPDGSPGLNVFAMMSYWYGALYVVVEGWHQLKLSAASIDRLLGDADKVRNLKSHRHATFHYQPEFYHNKFLSFMRGGAETSDWGRALHAAFDQFFSVWVQEQGYLDDETLRRYEEWKRKHPEGRFGRGGADPRELGRRARGVQSVGGSR